MKLPSIYFCSLVTSRLVRLGRSAKKTLRSAKTENTSFLFRLRRSSKVFLRILWVWKSKFDQVYVSLKAKVLETLFFNDAYLFLMKIAQSYLVRISKAKRLNLYPLSYVAKCPAISNISRTVEQHSSLKVLGSKYSNSGKIFLSQVSETHHFFELLLCLRFFKHSPSKNSPLNGW